VKRRAALAVPVAVSVGSAAALIAGAFLGSACGRAGCPRLEGRWRGVRAERASGETPTAAAAFARGTVLEVSGDTMRVTTPNETQSGHYRVVYENDATVTIATDTDGPDVPQTFTFEGAGSIRWLAAEGESIVFAKQ
jgi:hypothetical protein